VGYTQVLLNSFSLLFAQLLGLLPKLIVALIIWIIGKYLIGVGIGLVKRVEFKKLKAVDKFVDSLVFILTPVANILLFLIVMDYLGIGRNVISAIVSGFTYAVAIALGIAFGKALEDDARSVVNSVKRELEK
jgi:small conductance mechanosensitive channel